MKTRSKLSAADDVGGFPSVGDDRDGVAELLEHPLQELLIHHDVVRHQDPEPAWC